VLAEISHILPQCSGFLRQYVDYASQCSDAPEIYHVGVGLTVFSAALAKDLACPWSAGRILMPNLYTLLVGPSRSTRKTSSMDSGIDILQITDSSLVMPIPGSYEELVTQIRRKAHGLLTYREFGHFLKTTARGYGEPIRTVLMDLFDWPPDRPYTRNLKKGQTVINPPICLSMLGSIATDLLYAYSDTEEWTGGFFGRMLLLYGERENFIMPRPWPEARQYLVGMLTSYMSVKIPPCGGFSPHAWAAFTEWAQWQDSRTHLFPHRVQTFIAGTTTLAAKIALLFAADAGEWNAGIGWLVSLESLRRAILLVDRLYLQSVTHIGERLALGIWERDRQKVIDVIEGRKIGIKRNDLLRTVKMESGYLENVLQTLREEGTITQGAGPNGETVLKKAKPGTVAPVTKLRPGNDVATGVNEE
jgi:hypothetical protein